MIQEKLQFPFSAIVGQEDFKLVLMLNVIDPLLGGVLAIGDKGTGKTTLIRSLAALLDIEGDFPFVNLPIGVSEDRVLGHINLEKLINDKKEVLQLGLLAKANNGCLYIDEINLLNDYLMDILLDAAAVGSYYLEREGLSKKIESRFFLIGSMNPEEGDLRPQLKDRFGLSVAIKTEMNLSDRSQIIKNRLNFDDDPISFVKGFVDKEVALQQQLITAKKCLKTLRIEDGLIEKAAALALFHKVEGHRADILLLKTARAYAAFVAANKVTESHLKKIAPFVLLHRSNNMDSSPDQQEQETAPESEQESKQEEQPSEGAGNEHQFKSILPGNSPKPWKASSKITKQGVAIHSQESQQQVVPNPTTQKTMDVRKTVGQYLATDRFEFKQKFTQTNAQVHLMFIVDSSGSMLKDQMVSYAKGLVEKYSNAAPGKKPLFSLISLFKGEAVLLEDATHNLEQLQRSLEQLKTGGKTNIVAAFKLVKGISSRHPSSKLELIIITDAKFNSSEKNAFEEAVLACQTYCKGIENMTVVDAEKGRVKLGLAAKFAAKIHAKYERLETPNHV